MTTTQSLVSEHKHMGMTGGVGGQCLTPSGDPSVGSLSTAPLGSGWRSLQTCGCLELGLHKTRCSTCMAVCREVGCSGRATIW